MDTATINAAPAAIDDTRRRYAMRGDGKTLTIDAAHMQTFGLYELCLIAEKVETVRSLLLDLEDDSHLSDLDENPDLAAQGIRSLKASGKFVEEVGGWFSYLGDILHETIREAVPQDEREAGWKYSALLKREASFGFFAGDFMKMARLALDGAEEVNRLDIAREMERLGKPKEAE